MENYGNEYFMSQEGYASIDFTLLDRPNSNIASAPESTAALLPDLHVGDSSFSSFDFLDGPSVEAFGGLERFSKNADEVHSRDQGGYQSDLHKYKKDRSVLPNSMSLPRGEGDPDSELPPSEFQIPFEVQKPVSNLDFFSQGPTKDAGHQTQEAHSDHGNNSAGRNREHFEHGQIAQQSHPGAGGAGGWYSTWTGSNTHGDQTQVFLQTPSYDEASEERRLMQMKGSSSQLGGQFGYHSSSSAAVQDCDPMPKSTHSFLPTTKLSDSRQTSNTGLGLTGAQANESASPIVKSSPRKQAFDYESLMNGSSANQFRRNSSAAVENTGLSRRHQSSDSSLGGHDALRNHAQSQSFKYPGQQLGSLAPVEVSPLKVNDYDFVGGQYVSKAPSQGEMGRRLNSEEMQTWHEHPLLSQSNQQQASYQQPYQELSRPHHRADQQSQNSRQHQFQQSLAVNESHQSLGSQLSAFLTESSLQDLPRVAHSERQILQLAAESPRGLLQTNYQTVNNVTNLNWSSTDPASMEGLAHDYLMGADQNFNWQALALKADPSLYGSVQSRRDPTGQPHSAYAGMHGGLQEYYNVSGKLSSANSAQVGKPVVRTVGSGASGGSIYGGDYEAEVYDAAAANLQPMARSSKHQVLGKMPFWQAAYPTSVEHNRNATKLTQTNLPPRTPQVAANSPARQQNSWTGLSGQQDARSSGIFSQNLANAEALKQSLLASNLQQSTHQAPNALTSSRNMNVEAVRYYQQNSSQAGSGTQFLNALGTNEQSNWNRHSSQQSVPQAVVSGEASASLDSNQKKNWTSLNIHSKQASSESQSHSSLKQQNIWSGHTGPQNSGPASSLHLFTDLDGRRNSMHSSHDLQQQGSAQSSSSQQVEKVDLTPQLSHKISSSSLQGTEQPSTLLDLDTSQQSGWRDHSLLQGTTQTSNSLQAYQDLDKASSWKNIWQTPTAEVPSQLMQMDDSRHGTTLWGRNLQKASSHTVEPQVAAINSREQSSWNGRDVQQESPQTNQLLSSLDSHQGSHRSHSSDGRHCTDQFGHLLQDESALSKASASAEADAGQKASQNAYNVQVHLGTTETVMRHKASQSTYGLQSQVVVEADSRRNGNHSAYTLQSQLGVGEIDARQKASQNAYSLHSQIGTAETDPRQKASQSGYSLQSQVGTGETDARRKASQSAYSLQSQVGAGETEARHKAASHNTYSVHSHLGTGEADAPQRGNQNAYSLQTQVAAVQTDACGKSSQNAYNVLSQVGIIDTDSRHKGGQNAFSLQSQLGAYSQQNSVDGRQPRSHWPHSSQQGISQTGVPMYSFPCLATKNQTAQNSLNLQTWNSAMKNVEGWQQKGTVAVGGQFQELDLAHAENIDTRQQGAQSGSTSQHCSPQNESHLQSITNLRPPSRLGRLNNSQDNSLPGPSGTTAAKSAALSHGPTQGNNLNSASPSQNDAAAMWPRVQNLTGKGDVEKFNLRGESCSGTSESWTHGQKLTLQSEKGQLNLGVESDSCPNEALLHSWSHGQNLSSQKDLEQLNLGGVRKSGANELMWSHGHNTSVLKDVEQLNLAVEFSSVVNAVTPTWPQRQIAPVEMEVKQLKFVGGESRKEMTKGTLPAWSHGQVTSKLKDVQELNHAGESHSGTKDLPLWTQGENISVRSSVDQLSHGVDSSIVINEVMPAWSREQVAPAQVIQTDQFNTGETNRLGGDAVPTWSTGQSIHTQRDDRVSVEEESNSGKSDSLPSWRQKMVARKDFDQPNLPEDSNNCAINSGKDILNPGLDVENRGHKEVTFFDGGAGRESNILASSAPSPDSNPALSAAKQKDAMKTSSLSRNTLELLSRPEETTESMSANDEEEEEEDLDMEDSGANASSISLAHLRRNQASGPLSPQGFGLRLAPPSHLLQNSQAANSSRLGVDASRALSTQAHKVQQLAVALSGSDQALIRKEDQLDSVIEVEMGAVNHTPVLSVTFATANARHNARPTGEEYSSAEGVERSSATSSRLDESASQLSITNALNSGETGQPSGTAVPIAPVEVVDEMVEVVSNDWYGTGSPFNSFHSNLRGPLTISAGQKQYFSSNPAAQQPPTGSEQAGAALSKLSTFKDSLTGQVKSTFAQQPLQAEKGIPEKGTVGGFDSSCPPGFHSGHWSMDQSQSSMAKADLIKQIAAQGQSRGTLSSFDQLGTSSNSNSEKAITGSDAFLGQVSTAGEFNSEERRVSQVPCLPGKSVASFQSHSYQARPSQESSSALLHSAQIYNQGDMIQGQGMATEFSNLGQTYAQSHGFTGQKMMVEQPQSGNGHPFQRQSDIPGQSYPGQQTYPQSQILTGQPNASGQSSPGEIYNSNQGLLSQSSTPGLPPPRQAFAQLASAGHIFPGPETAGQPVLGQRVGQVVAGKQLKSRQHRRVAQKGEETDVNHEKMEGKIASQLSSDSAPQLLASLQAFQAQNAVAQKQVEQQKEVSSRVPGLQDSNSAASETQSASRPLTEALIPKDTISASNEGNEAVQKSNSREGCAKMQASQIRSNHEQFGSRSDNQGNLIQQWQNAMPLNSFPAITDQQFQRILEARPAIAAHLDTYKSDPRLYQLASAQIRASLGQAHMSRYQQQVRSQSALASNSVANPASRSATSVQASQFQSSQAVHSAQVAQGVHATQTAQTVQSGPPADQAALAAQAAKHAHTAARLQYLSQLSQRGHSANGLSPWFSGLVARSGSGITPYTSGLADGKSSDPALASALRATGGIKLTDEHAGSRFVQNLHNIPPPVKKRKEYPPLSPWREAISQSGGYVSSTSASELEWALATNRIPDTEPYEEGVDALDTTAVVLNRAKRRLRLSTHLMQQITPAVPATFMKSDSTEDREGATYTLSKLALAEACRIASIARRIRDVAAARDAEETRIEKERELRMKEAEKSGENIASILPFPPTNISDRFKLRMKALENDLRRLETSPSAFELVRDLHDTERLSLVNRLAAHSHNPLQNLDSRRASPQKYVTTVQMPGKLPEGLFCISL